MRINTIYSAIEGEGVAVGIPEVFIRTQGCTIGCKNCDTKESWKGDKGKDMTPMEILHEVVAYDLDRVSITGGNPLEQADLGDLIMLLKRRGFFVNIEATGQDYDAIVFVAADFISMDIKTPSTGVTAKIDNVEAILRTFIDLKLNEKIQLKCVCADQADLDFIIKQYYHLADQQLLLPYQMVITPCFYDELDKEFVEVICKTILEKKLPIRVIAQQHKLMLKDGLTRGDV